MPTLTQQRPSRVVQVPVRQLTVVKPRRPAARRMPFKRGDIVTDPSTGETFEVEQVNTAGMVATNVQDKSQWQIPAQEAATFTLSQSVRFDGGETYTFSEDVTADDNNAGLSAVSGDTLNVTEVAGDGTVTVDVVDADGVTNTYSVSTEELDSWVQMGVVRSRRRSKRDFNPAKPILPVAQQPVQPQVGDEVILAADLPQYDQVGGQVTGRAHRGVRGRLTNVISNNGKAAMYWAKVGRSVVAFKPADIRRKVIVRSLRRGR